MDSARSPALTAASGVELAVLLIFGHVSAETGNGIPGQSRGNRCLSAPQQVRNPNLELTLRIDRTIPVTKHQFVHHRPLGRFGSNALECLKSEKPHLAEGVSQSIDQCDF